jgi:hypothetical protein
VRLVWVALSAWWEWVVLLRPSAPLWLLLFAEQAAAAKVWPEAV